MRRQTRVVCASSRDRVPVLEQEQQDEHVSTTPTSRAVAENSADRIQLVAGRVKTRGHLEPERATLPCRASGAKDRSLRCTSSRVAAVAARRAT